MKKTFKKTSAFVCAMAVMAAPMTFSSFVANAEGETVTSDYTLTIPATLAVENSGWNSIGDLTATGTLAQGKKLNVTATSENSWKLTSGENTVAYKLCGETEKEKTYADAAATTSLDISKGSLEQTGGFSVPIGIVVEDYSTKPAGDYSDTVTFTASVESASVPVTAITLNKTATTISAGQTETLSVSSVTPDDATDQTVTWSSDNEAVATVDADGKVTAVALGTANITATANDGSGVTATCAVTVNKVVTINQSDWGRDWNPSFTKDGVTVSAGMIDPHDGNLMDGGSFSTTLGNFTKIVVTTTHSYVSGTGWSGGGSSMTWAGTPASTVSFSGDFMGMGMTPTTIVCTIEPTN